jgi:predicted Zn-dependent protease
MPALLASAIALALADPALAAADEPILEALQAELARTMQAWEGQEDAPYFLGYRVSDSFQVELRAEQGALAASRADRRCLLDVSVRVGNPELDNTHAIRDEYWFNQTGHQGLRLPCEGDVLALRTEIWRETDQEIRDALRTIHKVRANRSVKVEETDRSPDFSREEPQVHLGEPAALEFDPRAWEPVIAGLSALLLADPSVEVAMVQLDALARTQTIVTSEGTRIRQPRTWLRVAMEIGSTAPDGMELDLYRWKDVHTPGDLPSQEVLRGWTDELLRDHAALRAAPRGEPYSGPLILRGAAAGVFVHEVLGHRAEGHRQKDEDEGQTFRDQVGRLVTHPSITIYDDPRLETYANEFLNGHYLYDDEGQPAQRAVIIEDGVFRGFLMSRSPIEGFGQSNGHGRAQDGRLPVSRMGNTVVESSEPMPWEQLRRRLIQALREQGRAWGLVVDEIGGGFTTTGRTFPNSFNVRVETAWRVYADGRPDELVRGIDLVGTPLVAIGSIVAAGDDPAVFNGFCGAESGSVPNSAISPSLLMLQMEVQRKEKDQDRPPLLPRPDTEGEGRDS